MKVLSQALDDWRIVQVRREGNKVANEIILLSRRNIYSIVWLDSASICIMSLISDDCNSFVQIIRHPLYPKKKLQENEILAPVNSTQLDIYMLLGRNV